MSRLLVVPFVLVACAAWAPPVLAQDGNGLYEPFPQPRAQSRAHAFADRVGVPATSAELADGVFVGRSLAEPARAGDGAPSTRAGLGTSGTGIAAVLLAALAGLGLGVAAGARLRTPAPAS